MIQTRKCILSITLTFDSFISDYLLLIAFILGAILAIVYIPVVFIEMEWCGCLGTVKETVLKGAYEQSEFCVHCAAFNTLKYARYPKYASYEYLQTPYKQYVRASVLLALIFKGKLNSRQIKFKG